MRPESDPRRVEVDLAIVVTGITAPIRLFYRQVREAGLKRYDANVLTAGVVLAHHGNQGHVEFGVQE